MVDPNLLGDPDDLEPTLRGLELSRRIIAAPSFLALSGDRGSAGTRSSQGAEALGEYVRRAAATVHHPVGSCRMGRDPNAVVDAQLRVHGIAGLRVADASVFPRVVGGNTNAAVVMVAEKAADMIAGVSRHLPPAGTDALRS